MRPKEIRGSAGLLNLSGIWKILVEVPRRERCGFEEGMDTSRVYVVHDTSSTRRKHREAAVVLEARERKKQRFPKAG